MGCKPSKKNEEPLRVIDATAGGREIIIESEDLYDKQVISYIKDEIRNNPERFLLNNLLMSLVFFRNYDKDLYDFSNTAISKEETDLNSKLVKEVKKCIIPGALLDKIQENIKFCNEEGKYEQLSDKTVYVVNDNIEVKDRMDATLYTSIDVPGCQVEIEEIDEAADIQLFLPAQNQGAIKKKEGKERKGYLKLRVIESSSSSMKPNNFASRSISLKSQTSRRSKPTTPDVEELETSSDEYSTITAFKTPKSLNIVRTSERRDTLPETCFEVRKIKKLNSNKNFEESDSEQESEDEDDAEFEETLTERQRKKSELFANVTYLSSKGFMEYFQNEVFPNTTGKILGFSEAAIESAQAMPGCILCVNNQNQEDIPFRIVPAVAIDWPSQATEYIYRKSRNTIIDKRDGVVYKWPTNEMVRELRTLNCVVIPKGFVMKKGENESSDIEWEIHFPKAGRYLEMRMSHPQVRCYIFLLALYKTFIEKFTTYHGLLIEHLRTHMFWECEADARNWPEHKMGTKILQVIEDLNSGLAKGKIPHYFIKGRNIFEDIPSKYIQFAQKVFHDILQFPVMHFIVALKNLKYVHSDFYPAPDLDELYRLLTTKHNVRLSRAKPRRRESKKKKRNSVVQVGSQRNKQKQKIDDLKWKKKNEMNNRKKYLEQLKEKEKEEAEKAAKMKENNKNIRLLFSNLDYLKQISVLKFFMTHFIEIAKKSRTIGPKTQTLFYLKQAWYNMKVLEDIGGDSGETEQIITKEREQLERDSLQETESIAPPTPQRNAEPNAFIFHLNNSGKPGLKLATSFKKNGHAEVEIRQREKRLMRERRQKSVGFDDNVEVTFM